jgi:hypothetical protein
VWGRVSAARCLNPPPLGPHYRVSTLLWVAPTSKHHRPCPCSYTCSRVPASSGPTLGLVRCAVPASLRARPGLPGRAFGRPALPLVTAHSQCQARHGLGPRGVPAPLAGAQRRLLPTGGTKRSALTTQSFRGSTPSRSAPPVTFAPRQRISLHFDSSVTNRAARLATGLVAHDYPGGTPTR